MIDVRRLVLKVKCRWNYPESGILADFLTHDIELMGSAHIFIFGHIRIIAKSDY